MNTQLLTEKVLGFVTENSLERIDPWVVTLAKRTMLDGMAAMASGVKSHQVTCTLKSMEMAGCGKGRQNFSLWDQVFLWGVAAHSTEYNDMYDQLPGHPGAVIVPSVLTVGAFEKFGKKQVLEAYITGLETAGRINEILLPKHHKMGFHSTCVSGILGSAVAAGKLLLLNREEMGAALGLAMSFAGGLRRNFGYDGNTLQVARSSMDGVRAAYLARAGLKAECTLLDGDGNFFMAFHGRLEEAEKTLNLLGTKSVFEEPGIRIKKYPACYSVYQAVEAALMITRQSDFEWEKVEHISCLTSEHSFTSLPERNPKNRYARRFSVPYCVLVTLWEKCFGEDSFQEKAFPASFAVLLDQMEYGVHSEQKGKAGYGFTEVAVTLSGGRVLSGRAWPDPGERAENWSLENLEKKFNQCTEKLFTEQEKNHIRTEADTMEEDTPVDNLYKTLSLVWERREKNETD